MTYQVKNRFQNVPFKFNLQRYSVGGSATIARLKVGLYKLKSVYP
jgi:hypothetical protein